MTDDDDTRSQRAWTIAERQQLRGWVEEDPPPEFSSGLANAIVRGPTAARSSTEANAPHRTRAFIVTSSLLAVAVGGAAFFTGRASAPTPSAKSPQAGVERGEVAGLAERTSIAIGTRGVAVANAGSTLHWVVDELGTADVEQLQGSVFYRVERAGAFVVHTPAGDVHVTGTCFNVEIKMNSTKQKLASAAIGAVAAAAVVVTVYEGGVVVAHGSQRVAAGSGQTVSLAVPTPPTTSLANANATGSDAVATVTDSARASATPDIAHMSVAELRGRIAQLEEKLAAATKTAPQEYRGIHPNAETLQAWAKECTIRVDAPTFEDLEPHVEKANPRISAEDLPAYNAALAEVHHKWLARLRAAYLEVTGDQARVDTLEPAAMMREVLVKSGDDMTIIRARIANERAGNVAPPADGAPMTALERYARTQAALGDDTEAALGRRIGAARARQIRGEDGWWNQNGYISGCPDK